MERKKIIVLVFGGVSLLILGATIYYLNTFDIKLTPKTHKSSHAKKTIERRNLNVEPVAFNPELKKKLVVNSDCRPVFLDWSDGSYAQFLDSLSDAVRDKADCLLHGDSSKNYQYLVRVLLNCPFEDIIRQMRSTENYTNDCLTKAASFRNFIIDKVTAGEDLRSLSVEVLSQKLMATKLSEKSKGEKADDLIQIGDALMRRDPDLPQGYQAYAIGTVNKILSSQYEPTAAEKSRMEEAFDVLYEYPEQKKRVQQLEYSYYKGINDTARLEELQEEMATSAPSSTQATEYPVNYDSDFNFTESQQE